MQHDQPHGETIAQCLILKPENKRDDKRTLCIALAELLAMSKSQRKISYVQIYKEHLVKV